MRVEASHQPEIFWHCWSLPAGLSRDEAEQYFLSKVKPTPYTFEKFIYNRVTGQLRTA